MLLTTFYWCVFIVHSDGCHKGDVFQTHEVFDCIPSPHLPYPSLRPPLSLLPGPPSAFMPYVEMILCVLIKIQDPIFIGKKKHV